MEINIILQFFTKGLPDQKILKIFLWGSASLLRSQLRAGVPHATPLNGANRPTGVAPVVACISAGVQQPRWASCPP
jgi:hypothetical protein